jgi:hypothetical protein
MGYNENSRNFPGKKKRPSKNIKMKGTISYLLKLGILLLTVRYPKRYMIES